MAKSTQTHRSKLETHIKARNMLKKAIKHVMEAKRKDKC